MLKPIVRSILIASLAAGHAMAADPAAPAAAPVALHCPHLLDVVKGRTLGETTIIVESGRIRDVLPGFQTPAGATAIELPAQTCLPGLIDTHTHLTFEFNRTRYIDTFHWNVADYAVRSTVFANRTLLAETVDRTA